MKTEVIINNFNRYDSFRKLIEWLLLNQDIFKITIIDNGSTYPKLCNYYKNLINDRINLIIYPEGPHNHRQRISEYIKSFPSNQRFIMTDPDLIPLEECPSDWLNKLHHLLDQYLDIEKVGIGLHLDDIPDSYILKEETLKHEKSLTKTILPDGSKRSKVDGTFALYRDKTNFGSLHALRSSIRTSYPYEFRHVDWYVDLDNLSEEYKFYMNSKSNKCASYLYKLKRKIK